MKDLARIPAAGTVGLRETYSRIELARRADARGASIVPSARAEQRSSFEAIMKNVGPDELRLSATTLPLHQFLALYEETLFLLVHLAPQDRELDAGLRVTALRDEASVAVEPIPGSMWSRTQAHDALEWMSAHSGKNSDKDAILIQRLAGERHFAVPLRKRVTAEASPSNRISVGRWPSKDIVLRHGSVSKVHAYFEMDEDGVFYVTDAESKNGTQLNERRVGGTAVAVQPGDVLRFGAVETVVCAPRTLFSVVSLASKRAV